MNSSITSRVWVVPITLTLLALTWAGVTSAATTITSTLGAGSSGTNVTSLQQFLAADATLYPEGLVTGYYGSLTASAVQRFQCKQNIVCSGDAASTGYGRVGPRTLLAINALIGGGVSGDVSAPVMSGLVISTTTTAANITWTTNELARGTAYYSTLPLPLLEGSPTAAPVVGGQIVSETSLGLSHGLSITGLTANTVYFYAVRSEDSNGNLMFSWPSTFRTAQ